MSLSQKQKTEIDFQVERGLDDVFDAVYTAVEYPDDSLNPSDIAGYLNDRWDGLGDSYLEWAGLTEIGGMNE